MNYNHAYHAGSFTDVIKHLILTALLSSFSRKSTPLCYIDTHAGIGYYDLFSSFSTKTQEYTQGIEKIIKQDNPPPLALRYLDCVHRINNELSQSHFASLHYYPGSTLIARYLIRPQDRIIACELHAETYQTLKSHFAGDKQVAIHHLDGFLGLKAFLPPPERRGLVLIDPPYENIDEFTRIARSMHLAIKRWETGVYAIWYPLKQQAQIKPFYHALTTTLAKPIFIIECCIYPDIPNHLNGCGMAIINPPWQFEESIQTLLPWIWQGLTTPVTNTANTQSSNQQGYYAAYWL